MRASLPVAVILLVALAPASWAQNPQAVISWGTSCPTVVKNMNFTGPGAYRLWVAIKNLTPADQNVGVDLWLFAGTPVPDAWRFDDIGCQTQTRIASNNLPNTKACPAMLGTNPLSITGVEYDVATHRESLRFVYTYDAFTPATGITYTMWNIIFDHSHSVAGSDADPTTCDNAGAPLSIAISDPSDVDHQSYVLTTANVSEPLHFADPSDQSVTWNGEQPIATQPTTWGRIKSEYR